MDTEIFLLRAEEVEISVTAVVGYHPPDFLWIRSDISSFKHSLIFLVPSNYSIHFIKNSLKILNKFLHVIQLANSDTID